MAEEEKKYKEEMEQAKNKKEKDTKIVIKDTEKNKNCYLFETDKLLAEVK